MFGHKWGPFVHCHDRTARQVMEEIAHHYGAKVQYESPFNGPCEKIIGYGDIGLDLPPERLARLLTSSRLLISYRDGCFYCEELDPSLK